MALTGAVFGAVQFLEAKTIWRLERTTPYFERYESGEIGAARRTLAASLKAYQEQFSQIEQSGVLYTALAFGKPIVASDVGGFSDVGAAGGLRLVPPGDPLALREALAELIGDPDASAALAARAAELASSDYSWDSIAERTLAIYRELL